LLRHYAGAMTSNESDESDLETELGLVCVVDDDTSVTQSLRNLLASEGLQVETFDSAEAFLESDRHQVARCLVLDLQLPGMGGSELFARLATGERPIPVVILTAGCDDQVRERMLRDGASAFLTKPFRAADMLLAVRTGLSLSPRA